MRMPRETLDRQIHQIQDEVLLLGSMVEQSILDAVDALKQRDLVIARQITRDDHLVNEKRYAIENATLILIATQQPMAHDLRFLAAILEVTNELERMGDYAKGIARIVLRLGNDQLDIPNREFGKMAEMAISMLHRALSAFMNEDTRLAASIPPEDDQVDEMYNRIYRNIVAMMIANPGTIDHGNLLMWVAHNLERTADRATNICERTVFIATGELLELESPDDEDVI
jgi:phosphate transport system protein